MTKLLCAWNYCFKIHMMGRNVGGAVRWHTASFSKTPTLLASHHNENQLHRKQPYDKLCTRFQHMTLIPKLINLLNWRTNLNAGAIFNHLKSLSSTLPPSVTSIYKFNKVSQDIGRGIIGVLKLKLYIRRVS